MASVRKASYYSMKVPQRPGSGAQLLAALKAAKVNLLAFTGFPEGGGAQVDFVPQDNAKFLKAAKQAKLRISARKTAFLAQGDDRVGGGRGQAPLRRDPVGEAQGRGEGGARVARALTGIGEARRFPRQ